MSTLLFFFNDTATTEIYTLSLHDALPISTVLSSCPDAYLSEKIQQGSTTIDRKQKKCSLTLTSVRIVARLCNTSFERGWRARSTGRKERGGMDGGRPVGRKLTRREFLLTGVGAGAGVMILAGCGAARNQEAVAQAAAAGGAKYTGPKVGLGFWNGFTGGDGPIMLELVDRFNSEHENIKVDMVTMQWTDFYLKVPGAVAAGEGPTVAIMHIDQLALNAERGVIVPLDDVVQSLGLQKEDFRSE